MELKNVLGFDQYRRPDELLPEEMVVDLMVEFFEETGFLYAGKSLERPAGTAEDILRQIEKIIRDRWCYHVSFEEQQKELGRVLRSKEFVDRMQSIDR